jgi:lipopolysaccharide transport system permease protein
MSYEITIRPSDKTSILSIIKNLFSNFELIALMTRREISIRYKQAAVGIAWAVLQPVLTSLIFSVVFGIFARIPTGTVPYPIFVFSGLLLWQYFNRVVTDGCLSLVANTALITKVYFPRMIVPLTVVTAAAVDFCLSFVVLCVMMAFYHYAPPWTVICVPFILLMTGLLGFGISLWLAPLNAIYRDIAIVLPFCLQILMYLSPVIYPVSFIPQKYQWIFVLNPIGTLIQSMRWAMLGGEAPSLLSIGVCVALTAFVLSLGFRIFRSLEFKLVDRI